MNSPVIILSLAHGGGRIPCYYLRDLGYKHPTSNAITHETQALITWFGEFTREGLGHSSIPTKTSPELCRAWPLELTQQEHPFFLKQTRLVYVLDVIQSIYPDAHYIHMIRDGRDYAANLPQHLGHAHNPAVIRAKNPNKLPTPTELAKEWENVHLHVNEWLVDKPHVLIRMEDIVNDTPIGHTFRRQISTLLDAPIYDKELTWPLHRPMSMGCYLDMEPDERSHVYAACVRGLQRFNYV